MALLSLVLALSSAAPALASSPNAPLGTWNAYYYSGAGCTGAPWSPTVKSGGGFAANAPPSSNQDPVIAAPDTIYVRLVVDDPSAAGASVTYQLDGANGPYSGTVNTFTLDGAGGADVCFAISVTAAMANAVSGPSCTVPETIVVSGDGSGNLDHLVLQGSTNGNGCGTTYPAVVPLVSVNTVDPSYPSYTQTFAWSIGKTVDQTQLDIAAGGSATFSYSVTVTHSTPGPAVQSDWTVRGYGVVQNPNEGSISGVVVSDSVNDASASCLVSLDDAAFSGSVTVGVAASSSVTVYHICTYGAAPSASTETDTFLVTWSDQTLGNGQQIAAGSAPSSDTVEWSAATVTTVDGSVAVTDSLYGMLGTVSYTDPTPTTFTYSVTFSSDPAGTCTAHDNTATLTAGDTGATSSASQSVQVCVGADLTVSATASGAFTRTYTWTIAKYCGEASGTSVSCTYEQLGGSVTVPYSVVLSNSHTDSEWVVTGTITVTNPNDWEDVALGSVADAIDNGGTCSVAGGSAVVPAGGSVTYAYSCTYPAPPSPSSGTDTATATWDSVAYYTPDASSAGTAGVDFSTVSPLVVDGTVAVGDSLVGPLGTVSYGDGATSVITYAYSFAVPNDACSTNSNTATFTASTSGATGSAGASAKVCGKTGALSMGFWKNSGGQGIIKGGASASGVCNVGTWLRQYAAFQSLSPAATCSQVASYVSATISNANAKSATNNQMVSAQMLATALDVYFSDPTLGGNLIAAPAPVGGVTVALTSLGGHDVSPAFGGSASMTVSGMLSYMNNVYNGGNWYAGVKSTQSLAIGAFNFINNSA